MLQCKKRTNKGEQPFITIENHHEPIISEEQFQRVQEVMNNKKARKASNNSKKQKTINLFRCPYCKRKMHGKNNHISCRSGAISLDKQCSNVTAQRDTLEDVVVNTVNQIAEYVMECSQKLMKKTESCDIIECDISAVKMEIAKMPFEKMQNYDLYKQGKISAVQYQDTIEELHCLKEQLEEKLKKLIEEQETIKKASNHAEATQKIANEMLLFNGYDSAVISRFVKYIDVYSESEIEIFFDVDDVFFNNIISELE